MNSRAPIAQAVGAGALLVGGALHVRLAFDQYGTPNLMKLFFLNGLVSGLVVAWIALGPRPFAAIAGLGVSLVSLVAFGLSRIGNGIVGFRATGLAPAPDAALTLVAELVAAGILGAFVLSSRAELAGQARDLLANVRSRRK